MKPDYSEYTLKELHEALESIDEEAYPERHAELTALISKQPKTVENESRWIAGFWRRVFALLLDTFILFLVGFVLGLFFKETFIELGGWGIIIGFTVSLIYFGLMNSELGNGQTLGKRILNIRVVTPDNGLISVPRSFLRYSVLGIPAYLNGVHLNVNWLEFFMYLLSLIVFGGLISTIYLYLFNTKTRQSLHDIVTNTVVVNSASAQQSVDSVWKAHYYIVAGLMVLSLIAPMLTTSLINAEFDSLLATQKEIVKEPIIRHAIISDVVHTENSVTTVYVSAEAYITENKIDDVEFAQQIARTIILNYPDAMDKDYILVSFAYGFDIGIWSSWNVTNHQFIPEQLKNSDSKNNT